MKFPIQFFAFALLLKLPAFAAPAGKPNILLIVADDLGYGELSVQGYAKDIPTPHIDSIAINGTRFTNGYVSGPYCSPTRAGLLTGRYQQRFGHEFNPGQAVTSGAPVGLSTSEKTIADRLKPAGYATGWFGKSHLGSEPQFHPQQRGFDEFYGFLGGAHSYIEKGSGNNAILRGTQPVDEVGYATESFAQETVKFIEKHQAGPWFVYLPFNAVHAPLETLAKYEDRFKSISDPKRRRFAALLSALDDGVGSVLAKLRELKLEENTLIVFHSDNGGPTASITSGNGPLRGYKAQTWEGGIRVPFFAQWKGTLPAGKVDARPVIQLDILPTALAAAGVEVKPEWKLDGVNLLPYLKGENPAAPHDALFWRFGQQLAVRQGNWKLVKGQVGPGTGKASVEGAELYDLATDIGETNNLAGKNPDKVKALAALWETWNSGLVDPTWTPGGGGKGKRQRPDSAPAQTSSASASAQGPWKSGDQIAGREAPRIAGKPLAVSAEIAPEGKDGVIVAQGAGSQGFVFFLTDNKLAFAVRAGKVLTTATAAEPLPPGRHLVAAKLSADGTVLFTVDGRDAGSGKVSGLVPAQPGEGLTVGQDGGGAVGDYTAPHALGGKIEDVSVTVL